MNYMGLVRLIAIILIAFPELLFSNDSPENTNLEKEFNGINITPIISTQISDREDLTIADIMEEKDSFRPVSFNAIYFPPHKEIWLRLNIQEVYKALKESGIDAVEDPVLMFDTKMFYTLDFFYAIGDNYIAISIQDKSGFAVEGYQQSRFTSIHIPANANIEEDIYFRIRTEGFLGRLLLFSQREFSEYVYFDTLFWGAVFGAFLIMLAYNLLIYLTLKNIVYLHYSIYLFCFAFFLFMFSSVVHTFRIFPLSLIAFLFPIFGTLTLVSNQILVRSFLNLKKNSPILNKIILANIAILILIQLSAMTGLYHFPAVILNYYSMAITLFTIAISIYLSMKGLRAAKFFILAWIVQFAGTILVYLSLVKVIHKSFISHHASIIGSVIMMALLSLALADRFKNWRDERKKFKESSDFYENLSIKDELTGLFNRRFFMTKLISEHGIIKQHNLPLSLILIDIDHFKELNDTHGHLAGDEMLIFLADTLKRELRDQDVKSRFGGEEFIVLLPGTDIETAGTLAERIRHTVELHKKRISSGGMLSITVSCGVAQCKQEETKEEFINRVDKAMYKAKENGRNRIEFAD